VAISVIDRQRPAGGLDLKAYQSRAPASPALIPLSGEKTSHSLISFDLRQSSCFGGEGKGVGEGDERMQRPSQRCHNCRTQAAGFEVIITVTTKNTSKCKRQGEHRLQRAPPDL
jgi:hypothetical protein